MWTDGQTFRGTEGQKYGQTDRRAGGQKYGETSRRNLESRNEMFLRFAEAPLHLR
jgi:hypothetical protein